jgi:hypothetical protein
MIGGPQFLDHPDPCRLIQLTGARGWLMGIRAQIFHFDFASYLQIVLVLLISLKSHSAFGDSGKFFPLSNLSN